MIEDIVCHHCQYVITRLNLAKFGHIELECPECEAWNEYDHDPNRYVLKS